MANETEQTWNASESPVAGSGNETASKTTTVGELRKEHGPHFAAGYGDQDPISQVLGRAGVSSVEEYLKQHNQGK